jgi:predicted enzyme related to lactoylglutathione lyase
MSEEQSRPPGTIAWHDLTVGDADGVRDFYAAVVGWTPEPVSMGDYQDWNMVGSDGVPRAGICHARGGNAELPPVWIMYVTVDDLDAAVEAVREKGGALVTDVRSMGEARWVVVRDPAGAVFALWG